MKKIIVTLSLLWIVSLSTMMAFASLNDDGDVIHIDSRSTRMAYRPNEVIVKFKENKNILLSKGRSRVSASLQDVDAVFNKLKVSRSSQLMSKIGPMSGRSSSITQSYSGVEIKESDMSSLYLLELSEDSKISIPEVVCMLDSLPEVEFAEPNYLVYALSAGDEAIYTREPMYSQQWGLPAINIPALWEKPRIRERKSVIAILDTGIDITHPDLATNIWTNTVEADGNESADDDQNGYKNDIHGWDFVNNSPNIRDNNGHGTHCAGIAAAVGDNGIGITGANPDALIMPVTVLQSTGAGDVATIIKGIDYAVANGADIISMSFGTYTYSAAMEQALGKAYQKAVLVAAAGNDGKCIGDCNTHTHNPYLPSGPCFPAAFHFVIGVQAGDTRGISSFSNYDFDGATTSNYVENKLYNYEISAPGIGILSTFPNGQYKSLTGTSMACPLVSGALSRLLDVKSYSSKEELLGDIIHAGKVLDINKVCEVKKEEQIPDLQIVSVNPSDMEGDDDGHFNAGEIITLYPILRNCWGYAQNIKLSLSFDENEDPTIIEILDNNVDFGYDLGYYASAKSKNPIRFRIAKKCADKRIIRMIISVTSNGMNHGISGRYILEAESGVELNGIISKDMTLYPDKRYIINGKLLITEGTTLTVKPGVTINFHDNAQIRNLGNFKAIGTPDSLINMNGCIDRGVYEYVKFDVTGEDSYCFNNVGGHFTNCIFYGLTWYIPSGTDKCNFIECTDNLSNSGTFNNIGNCRTAIFSWSSFAYGNNIVGNTLLGVSNVTEGKICSALWKSSSVAEDILPVTYLGSANNDIIRQTIFDANNPIEKMGHGTLDYSNHANKPFAEAHGIVWKIVVDGYDAQDEFNQLPPLGVGLHKFEIYFNRPMDTSITPSVSMGARSPYTQTVIAENGSWSQDGTVYTVYLNATARNVAEGLNSIFVFKAQDLEHFEIPSEYRRFHVMVQTAGSMSSGLLAEAGLGKVSLKWNEYNEESSDFLGLNLYRYEMDSNGIPLDTICINSYPMESNIVEYTDYNITSGKTYYYFLSEMTTDMVSTILTNTVAVTPMTTTLGDANGSATVDVADIVTDIAYITHQDPKPFIFEAADINNDETIDIFDIVGTINIILSPSFATAEYQSTVHFYIKDGMLCMHNDIPVSGLQFTLSGANVGECTISESLNGFETTSFSESPNSRSWMIYSLCGRSILAGDHEIMRVKGTSITDVRISDVRGNKIKVNVNNPTGICQPTNAEVSDANRVVVLDSSGIFVVGGVSTIDRQAEWLLQHRLQHGVYFVCYYSKTGKLIKVNKVAI